MHNLLQNALGLKWVGTIYIIVGSLYYNIKFLEGTVVVWCYINKLETELCSEPNPNPQQVSGDLVDARRFITEKWPSRCLCSGSLRLWMDFSY